MVSRVIDRAAFLTGLTPYHAEDVQVVHYLPEKEYREHADYFSPSQDATYAERTAITGNRLISLFCCLSEADSGGATAFPHLGLRFELKQGEALLWSNIDNSGTLDGRTIHAGRPVEAGEKYGMNVWLRQRPIVDAEAAAVGSGEANAKPPPAPRQTQAHPAAQAANAGLKERVS